MVIWTLEYKVTHYTRALWSTNVFAILRII